MEKDEVKGKKTWQTEAGYEVLAAEIVHAAMVDYMQAKRDGNMGKVVALQKFFRSDWCHLLCGSDGDVLIEAADKKCEKLKFIREKKKKPNTSKLNKPSKPNRYIEKVEVPVVQVDFDGNVVATYKSIAEASRQTGIGKANIANVAKKRIGYKSAGGYRWEYAEKRI